MELTPWMEKFVKEEFGLEIEMLQGDKENMPDGRVKYTFHIEGEKADRIKEIMLQLISDSNNINPN